MLEQLTKQKKTIGVKQSVKAIRDKKATVVYIACDADPALTEPVRQLCAAQDLPVCDGHSWKELGAAGGIAGGAAVIAVLQA